MHLLTCKKSFVYRHFFKTVNLDRFQTDYLSFIPFRLKKIASDHVWIHRVISPMSEFEVRMMGVREF